MRKALAAAWLLSLTLASAAHAQVKLEFKRQEGAVSTRSAASTHQILNLAGMDVETRSDSVTTFNTTTGKPAPDGTVRVEHRTDAIALKVDLPGGLKLEFDSRKPDAKSDLPQIQAVLDALRAQQGATYTTVLDKEGHIVSIEGTDRVIAAATPAGAEILRAELNPERLKKAAAQALGLLPDKPVNKGDRWKRVETHSIGSGQTLTFDTYYEYQGTVEKEGRTLDKLGIFLATVSYAIDPNAPLPVRVARSDLKIDSSTGYVLFDRERGMVVERSANTHITGPLTLTVNGMELPGKLDLTMDLNITTR